MRFDGDNSKTVIVLRLVPEMRFRMDHVCQNFFWYYRTPRYENGIQIRDMLVFRYDLADNTSREHGRPKSRASK